MKNSFLLLLITIFTFSAFAADGDPDTSFNGSGVVSETFYPLGSFNYGIAVQADGKILSSGYTVDLSGFTDFTLVRYNADGTRDTSFGTNGRVTADDSTSDNFPEVFALADGKILLVGQSRDAQNVPKIVMFRFNANGSIDPTFGANGKVVSAFTINGSSSNGDNLFDALVQPDGRIVIAGGWRGTAFCVARFTASGTLDTAFGAGGDRCAQSATVGTGIFRSVTLQPDGKIVAAGKYQTAFNVASDFIVFRFDPSGSLDTSFDGDGYAITDLNQNYDEAYSVHVLPDGKILAAGRGGITGSSQYGYGFARYNANGSLDATFDGDGKTVQMPRNTSGTERYPAVVLNNGKIVVARNIGPATGFFDDVQIARFNADGSLDSSFGSGGQVLFPDIRIVNNITKQNDGKILFAGIGEDVTAKTVRLLNTDSNPPINNPALRIADFDGDGKSDASVFRGGTWFISPSSAPSLTAPNAAYSVPFGQAGDRLAPADYDGDGRTDLAVWRETEQNFYILNSSNNAVRVENFGLTGDIPTPGDWDGDGKADLAVYRDGAQGHFFYRGTANNPSANITYLPWGAAGDKPVTGDFDGDRKLDAAIYRAADQTWYIRQSSDGQPVYRTFGLADDKRVAGDFDGDGKTDVTVFRDGVWYILQSSNNQIRYVYWGAASDTLVAGDYDGDGKTDFAVWRGGVYYVLNSAGSAVSYQYFGSAGDAPVAAAFVQ